MAFAGFSLVFLGLINLFFGGGYSIITPDPTTSSLDSITDPEILAKIGKLTVECYILFDTVFFKDVYLDQLDQEDLLKIHELLTRFGFFQWPQAEKIMFFNWFNIQFSVLLPRP